MKLSFLIILAILCTLSAITIPVIQTRSQAMSDQLSPGEALTLMRVLSTTEAEKKQKEQSYVTLQKLLERRLPQRRLQEIHLLDGNSATILDYRLSVVTSGDGQHFQISLVPKSGCGYSLFTNESIVIYEAKALGCSDK